MFKRRTSKVRHRRQVKVLQAHVMSPRIFWFDFLRLCGRLVKLALLLVLLGAAGWGIWKGSQHVLVDNDEFRLRKIDLNENPALDEIRLLEVTGIDLSGSLFECDAGEIEDKLRSLPELTGAKVRREFPGSLEVVVSARRPRVWISCPSQGILPRDRLNGLVVDKAGYAFRCSRGMHEEALALPVIELRESERALEPGKFVKHDDYLRGVRLLSAVREARADAPLWVDTIRQYKSWSSRMITRDGMVATFGHDEIDRQVNDFLSAVEHAREKGDRIATIQLLGKRNQPVTFHESAAPRAIPVEENVVGGSSSADPEPEPAPIPVRDLRELLER